MTKDAKIMACEQFQSRLPELIGSGKKLDAHPHLQQCPRCRALLADLETIAETARQLFPVAEPPDDLWLQIESALQKEEALPQQGPGSVS
jgi:predicted anti-sigma-YlaC factor YlaD